MSLSESYRILTQADTGLVVVDIQEKIIPAMQTEIISSTLKNVSILIKATKILNIPVLVTEQYPKGLGPTYSEIKNILNPFIPYEKITFSCYRQPDFARELSHLKLKNILLCGMETHVCVYQTALDLLGQSMHVFAPADALCSRTMTNHQAGLQLMRDAGVVVGSTETFLFQLLEKAGTPAFKEISHLVK